MPCPSPTSSGSCNTLEAVGYPYLIALSSYNRLLTTAGLPELTLADNEAAVYCDSEVSWPAARR